MSGSSIPAVLDYLVQLFTAANVSGLQVVDGPVYDVTRDFLAVGWDKSGMQGAVTGTVTPATQNLRVNREQYEVTCLLSLWVGTKNLSTLRSQIFTTFDALDAALAADRKLGGLVFSAVVSTFVMDVAVEEGGEFIAYRFGIAIDAMT